jgi:hypothetical protein
MRIDVACLRRKVGKSEFVLPQEWEGGRFHEAFSFSIMEATAV